MLAHVSLILDSGWTQIPQANIMHGGKNCNQVCRTGILKGLEIHCISVPTDPIARKSRSPAATKRRRCESTYLHYKHVLWLVVRQMVSPSSPPRSSLQSESEEEVLKRSSSLTIRPKPCMWLMVGKGGCGPEESKRASSRSPVAYKEPGSRMHIRNSFHLSTWNRTICGIKAE